VNKYKSIAVTVHNMGGNGEILRALNW